MKRSAIFILVLLIIFTSCQKENVSIQSEEQAKLSRLIKKLEDTGYNLTSEIVRLADFYEFLLAKKDSLKQFHEPSKYEFNGGPFSNNLPGEDSVLSSLSILNTTPDYAQALDEVVYTNGLDSAFKRLINRYKVVAQIYANSKNQVSRVYPSFDAMNLVNPNIDVKDFNFYYEADLENNPSKGPIWIPEPYVDPAGRGWILSLIHPVFENEELFAVLGIDVKVDVVIERFLDEEEGNLLIVNKKGDIVAGKASAIEALSMPPLKNHVYRETIKEDNFRVSDFNLFNSKSLDVRKMIQDFNLKGSTYYKFEDEPYLIDAYCQSFNLIDWYLIEINTKI
ncbi:cache domain-containing protein [Algoriphagus sp. CAU 1675]|uniref:cache domain-containing protein n=1 Tax=Algoriphagus sp. CAU 1675 TaxID=3032597 RepID=UPI0023DA3924|nr:cache domain-containing protein [Algoriphagus sp. CAU 1675]MDF2158075.1 cache domain-containing protein [Algoriphagus sp. CAU 1675]